MADFPTQAQIVIVGGGIIGASTAYHLAKLGLKDVVLLERHKLTSGSTFHAAGLVGQLRSNANITQLLGESVKLYQTLEQETGLATGWKMNGGLRLACTQERWTEVKRQATTARSFGLEMHLLSPQEAQDLWPLMDVSDVIGAAFLPTDGQANPSDITGSLAKGARMHGARILEDTEVTGFRIANGRVTTVETDRGPIACEIVVNCAGQWARKVGRMAGVNVPLVSVEHQYMITDRIEGVTSTLPTLRDPDRLTYYKEEVGGLVMGGYEPNPIAWGLDGFPKGFNFQLLQSNFDHFEQLMELALGRVPALETAGVKELINGPESFTPDGNFILGQAPELTGFFVGAGFNAFGIASGGGAGKALAEWIAGGRAPYDLAPVDILRFGRNHQDVAWVRERTLEAYGKHYTIAWPHEEHASGRPLRRSPLYDRLRAQGAVFGEKLGWERPNWFAQPGEEARDRYTFGRPNWTDAVAREHAAVREAVGLFDQTSFAKFRMVGRDAEAALSWLSAADLAYAPGTITVAPMLNARGGVECDLTAVRVAPDDYYLVAGTGAATKDFDWLRRNTPQGLDAHLIDVSSAYGVLSLMGPNARRTLERVCSDDVSNDGFPFARAKRINVAGAPTLALRVTYVGELGFELHLPVEFTATVYDALMAAGADLGIANAGYRAIETLRLEKGYWASGSDVGPDHTPFEAGFGWAVALGKTADFLGRDALRAAQGQRLKKRLAGFTVDDPSIVLLGRETIYRNGERVGWLSSGGFGHTLGKPIGYGYVRQPEGGLDEAFVLSGAYELDVATVRVPATVHLAPLYDPEMRRMLA
ncbi:4-methylaminobutanoate oxidase (formaldehyde-forming) [Methylopila capsulata]|uniref:4-methylaminobutanoate oxidase (Formaldehyde-forming) n=1 Tax=Methylopila capsulata TaxID=61654 RepID=A0A9W6ITV1_9HYPH|nr:FAD-dependent oxidoreductase [Methylopila capsulata]MBM7852212.1 4-methylaminobutanoate oxidase (formaldehyde-forming) [Methylopila capsulata]GLK56418.1 FAD-dependent oxidoreductase [Methylopila capsulata]